MKESELIKEFLRFYHLHDEWPGFQKDIIKEWEIRASDLSNKYREVYSKCVTKVKSAPSKAPAIPKPQRPG